MYVFRHDHVSKDAESPGAPHPLQRLLKEATVRFFREQPAAVIAAEGDEMNLARSFGSASGGWAWDSLFSVSLDLFSTLFSTLYPTQANCGLEWATRDLGTRSVWWNKWCPVYAQ
jgi:hypothetical protein